MKMNRRIVVSLISLVFCLFVCLIGVYSEETSKTGTISFTKNVVVKKYKMGEVKAEPYTVEKKDNLWKILTNNFGIKDRQFYFFCRITKSLNPDLKNAHKIVPNQILLIPFKYIAHFNIPEEDIRSALLKVISTQLSQVPTEEYTFSKGEHVVQVLRDMYYIPDDIIFNKYLNLIKKLNPDLEDINLVKPDQKIILPSFASYPLPPEEETLAEKAKTEELPATEGILDEKEAESVYVDPRFRAIPRLISGSKTSYMQSIASITDVLQGKLSSSGEFAIPLIKEGQITIDANEFPVLQLTDNKKIILSYGGEPLGRLENLLQSKQDFFEVVTFEENEKMESVLDKLFNAAGYYSVDKSKNPLVIGDKIQFEIAGDWIIYADELLEDIMVVNLIEKKSRPINSHLKDYIQTHGVNLIDLYMMSKGEQEGVSSSQKTFESSYHPEDIPVIYASDSEVLVDSLLALLGQNYEKDFKVKLFQEESEGFDVEVMANRYFERRGKEHIISFHKIPDKLIELITEQGNRFLGISLPSGDPFAVIKSLLDFLHVDYEYPRPRFSNVVDGKGLELIIPGILIKQDKKESILLTSLELESEVYQWLMEEKLKIVRLEV
jgi:hypothetical protein